MSPILSCFMLADFLASYLQALFVAYKIKLVLFDLFLLSANLLQRPEATMNVMALVVFTLQNPTLLYP